LSGPAVIAKTFHNQDKTCKTGWMSFPRRGNCVLSNRVSGTTERRLTEIREEVAALEHNRINEAEVAGALAGFEPV
jgi:hypothetical protein